MDEEAGSIELQQLVQEEGSEEQLSRDDGNGTPPTTPTEENPQPEGEIHASHRLQQVMWEKKLETKAQTTSDKSKDSSVSPPITSQGSMTGNAPNSYSHTGAYPKVIYVNEKEKTKPSTSRPDIPPRASRLPKVSIPYKHHTFLSEVPDVRQMEQALSQLLEDFHSGNLSAFGKGCSMEQMNDIREQQEKLAKLHFEMGQQENSGDESGFKQSSANMQNLLQRLEQLSVCIEKLHSK